MKKDDVILSETLYIATVSLIFSIILQGVLFIFGLWSQKILLCGILGYICAVLNFFLLGQTLKCAISKSRDESKRILSLSQLGRTLLILIIVLAGALSGGLNVIFVLIPLLFPRIAIAIRPFFKR